MAQRSQAHVALGQAIRSYRVELGLSQEELYRSGLHRTYFGGIERGERNPSFANLLKVAGALGVPTSRLIERAEDIREDEGGGTRAGERGVPTASR